MDQAVSSGLVKKLAMVGLFLLAVLLLVGGEEDPGLIGKLGEDANGQPVAPDRAAPLPESAAPAPRRAARQDDGSLSAWYAASEPEGAQAPAPAAPEPKDESHLINDAKPMVDAAPIVPPDAIVIDRVEAAPTE